MRIISALKRVLLMFVLLLLLLWVGGSYPTPTTSAQRTCYYRLAKITSCVDDKNKDYCQIARDLTMSKFADGSVNAIVPGKSTQESCVLTYKPDGGVFVTCPSGGSRVGWHVPPQYLFPDEGFRLSMDAIAEGTYAYISGKYWFDPAGALKARPGGTGRSGGIVPAGVADPFEWIEVTKEESGRTNVVKTGQIDVMPVPGLDKFSLGVVISGWGKKPGGNGTDNVGYGVEYIYERCTEGQVPPGSGAPVTPGSTGPGSSTGPGAPVTPNTLSGSGSSTVTGASNTTLPMPPFGQAEPNTNTPGMAIQAAQRRVMTGELVQVPVWLIKGNNVANINYELSYNASVARPEGTIRKGYLLDNASFSANPNTSGIIRVGFAQATGTSGTGPLTYIPFRAVGKAGDRTPLSLAVTTINNPAGATLAIDRIPGEIVIVDRNGLTPGDCEGTGKPLSALDVMCALEMSVKLIPTRLIMDMDNNGDVTSRDAAIIAQRILQIVR